MRDDLKYLLAQPSLRADGAYGTNLRAHAPADSPVELLNLVAPDRVLALAKGYVNAGAQALWTNTFGLTLPALRENPRRVEILRAGVRIACEASGGHVPVFASLGPAAASACNAEAIYLPFADAAIEAGACAIVLETMTSASEAARAAKCLTSAGIPVFVSFTAKYGANGGLCTHCGTPLINAAHAVLEAGARAVGINCCDGHETVLAAIKVLRESVQAPLFARPNAGITHTLAPAEFAPWLDHLTAAGAWLTGGCCGTTPEHLTRHQG